MKCSKCGLCRSFCPVFEVEGIESVSSRGKLRIVDKKIKNARAAELLLLCATCYACNELCPSGVEVVESILDGRKALREFLPEKIEQLKKTVEETGNIFGKTDGTEKKEGTIQYYAGCLARYRTDDYKSTLKLLDKLDVDYAIEKEICCGEIFEVLGMPEVTEKLRKMNTFKDEVIVTCPGCYKTLKPVANVKHLAEFLDEKKFRFKHKPVRVLYHDPCHLGRALGIYDEPRNVLKRVEGVTVREFKDNRENSKCCGGGGSLSALNPRTSVKMAENRVKDADADIIVTCCPACKVNLRLGCKRLKRDIEVLNLPEFLTRCEVVKQ